MKKYEVDIQRLLFWKIEVDANDEDEAYEIAMELQSNNEPWKDEMLECDVTEIKPKLKNGEVRLIFPK